MKLKTTCNRDCPDACSIVATVEDDRVVRLEGDPDHPVTQGFLCYRTNRFLERQYDPDRVTEPLVRRGDGFEPVSWEAALDLIADTMLRVRRESGSAALLHYRCGGSLGLMKNVTDYFFERFGPVTIKTGDICTGAGDAAQEADFGEEESHDIFDLLNSRNIVLWGKNPYVGNVHLLPVLREARSRGARIVLVDPVHHRMAAASDAYVQPRPGGDMALALGVARRLFERGLADPDAASTCDHLDDFRSLAFSRDDAEWARLADVTPAEVDLLCDALAGKPAALLIGWGLQRRLNGSATVRVLDALGAISGNLGIPGGGVSFYFKRRGAFDLSFVGGARTAPRTVREARLGADVLDASDPPIRFAWVTAANPVAMLPDSSSVARALSSREMTVVVDSFLTDTARCAHVVLPTTTMLEDDDLLGAYGHHWLAESRPVVAPPAAVKTDYEIVRALAPRVGLADEFSDDADAWKRRLLGRVADRGASLEDLRRGPVRNPLVKDVLFADRRFPTASGRVNLIRHADPTPPSGTAERPFLLMSLSTDKAQGSQTSARAQDAPLVATVHPDVARGFGDGAFATLESELGAITVALRFDERQRRDVVIVPKGGWLRSGRCANALIPARESDAGGCAAYHDTPVRLLPAG